MTLKMIQILKNGLTLKIKVNHQGWVIENGFSEIPNFENVRIDTKIESIVSILPEIAMSYEECVWPWVSRSNVEDTWIILTFSTFWASKLLKSIQRSCLYDVYNQRYERTYTNVFDLQFQGQPSRSGDWFWVFWDPQPCKCQNRHQDQVCSLYTAGDEKGHTMSVCNLEFQSQPSRSHNFFIIFDILDLENVRSDIKINFVSCLQPEIRKDIQKCVWSWFSRSCN